MNNHELRKWISIGFDQRMIAFSLYNVLRPCKAADRTNTILQIVCESPPSENVKIQDRRIQVVIDATIIQTPLNCVGVYVLSGKMY